MESGAALVVARWVFFSSAMTVFGVALFPLYALRSSRDGEGVIGFQPLIFGAAVLALASSLAWLALITVNFGGEDAASFDPFFTFFLGGVAAFDGDMRVGAVGVSGLPGEEDEALARRAIEAAGLSAR